MEAQMDWVIEAKRGDEWEMVEVLRGFTHQMAEERLRRPRRPRHIDSLPVWRLRPLGEDR